MSNYSFLDATGTSRNAAATSVASGLSPQVTLVDSTGTNIAVVGADGAIKVTGSIVTTSSPASVSGTVGASIIGTVPVTMAGAWTTSVVGGVSILGGSVSPTPASVSGVGLFNVNVTGNGSILAVPTSSTIAIIQSASIAGTYTEDSAHTTADRGIFTLNVRNDTMSSITSADGDYSPMAVGPTGEVIFANAPITKWVSAQTSVMYGTSVQAIAPQGASVFTYITGMQVANDSATFSRVKITGGLGSVLAWTVAPANGGSNIVFANPIKTGENSGVSASINGVSSVYVSFQGFISKI